jgi:hypothetical protein
VAGGIGFDAAARGAVGGALVVEAQPPNKTIEKRQNAVQAQRRGR